ncbi:MAG TPA: alpha/beta hydrolase [Micromonosporaceae bacterium]|nr:alpha/beta hydrolase [Micromonosporaceae bacterium]
MARYVELPGVQTWYDEHGDGEPLLLLHGGVVDARFFDKNLAPLADRFHVFTPERRGHGHTPDVDEPFTYDLMAQDTIAFLEAVVDGPAHLVGHSDGAVVAMLVALRRADLVRRLVIVGGGFHYDGLMPGAEQIDVGEVVTSMGAAYGEVSPDGEDHFPVVVKKVARMAATEPTLAQSELNGITNPTLLMFGDDDILSMEHITAMYDGIPGSQLAVVPGTSHFLLQEKPTLCNTIMVDFLTKEPVATVAPIRRARSAERGD